MFEDIQKALRDLLETKFVNVAPQLIKKVEIANDFQKNFVFSFSTLPAIVIVPGNQLTEPGPIANGATRIFNVNLQLFSISASLNKARFNSGTFLGIYSLHDLIIQELARNKMLVNKANQLVLPFQANELIAVTSDGVPQTGLEIPIQYRRFVTWDGAANSQQFVDPVVQTGVVF